MPAGTTYGLDSRDLISTFFPRLESAMEKIWAPRISVELPSSREVEELAWLGQVPVMRRWIGGRKEMVINKYTTTVRNYPYEATLVISIDDLRRDRTGQIRERIGELADRTATHWNSLVGNWVTAGEAGTNGLAYDAQFLYDTDHNESGTNQTNDLTATEVPSANVATTSTLTTTEAANILTETTAYMMGLTDDQGEPINQGITEVLVLTTKAGHYQGMKTAIGLNNLGTGSGNNNPVLAWNDVTFSVVYVPQRITAADKIYFFFGAGGAGSSALIRTSEQDVTTRMHDETFLNRRQLFGVDAVRGIAYGQWQRTALVTLS